MAKTIPNYAGLRQWRKNRLTGTIISLYDGIEQGMDTDGGRWQTMCEDHGNIISHDTYALALSHMSYPEWCEECLEVLIEKGW